MNFKDQIKHLKTFFTPSVKNVILLIRWLITAVFTGLLVGAVGTLFYYAMSFVTGCRTAHPILIYLLPFAGLLIIFLYRVSGQYNNTGTNLVLSSIQTCYRISAKVAPLIFVTTLINYLFRGSSRR